MPCNRLSPCLPNFPIPLPPVALQMTNPQSPLYLLSPTARSLSSVFLGCATLISKVWVAPYLAAGPSDGSTCSPFDRAMGDVVDPPVLPGEGFDLLDTQSHLVRAFGFNNICANWDYSPSSEITALI